MQQQQQRRRRWRQAGPVTRKEGRTIGAPASVTNDARELIVSVRYAYPPQPPVISQRATVLSACLSIPAACLSLLLSVCPCLRVTRLP